MGYYVVMGPCLVCKRVFGYNPERVPSHPSRRTADGKLAPSTNPDDPKEPICQDCIKVVNEARKQKGEPTWHVHPDAYEPTEGFPP